MIVAESECWHLSKFDLENRRKSSQIINYGIYLPLSFLFILFMRHTEEYLVYMKPNINFVVGIHIHRYGTGTKAVQQATTIDSLLDGTVPSLYIDQSA